MTTVRVEEFVADEGTIFIFRGVETESGDDVLFTADHRPGSVIVEAIYNQVEGIEEDEEILADVPEWAVMSRVRPLT